MMTRFLSVHVVCLFLFSGAILKISPVSFPLNKSAKHSLVLERLLISEIAKDGPNYERRFKLLFPRVTA
jgi:hypothetical protein